MVTCRDLGASDCALLDGRVSIRQPARGYRVSIDAVLLAAATQPPNGALLMDLGCGVGSAMLCLLHRRRDLEVLGVEIQPALLALAKENAEANGVSERCRLVEADAADLPACLRQSSFDWVISNPPFHAQGSGGGSPLAAKSRSNQECSLDLQGWINVMLTRLRPGGGLTLVHRSDRLPALLAALEGRAGAITMLPLWPKANEPAKRLLLTARKGSRAPARLLPGLVLHRADGSFTGEAEDVLRGGAALTL